MLTFRSAYRVHNDEICRLVFFPDGGTLLSATAEMDAEAELEAGETESDEVGVLKVWNSRQGVLLSRRKYDYANAPVLSPDGHWIAWGGYQARLRVIAVDQPSADQVIRIGDTWQRPERLLFLPGSTNLLFGLAEDWWQWDVTTAWPGHRLDLPVACVYGASADGRQLIVGVVTVGDEQKITLQLWDLHQHRALCSLPPHGDGPRTVVRHPTRPLLADCGWWESGFQVWDVSDHASPRRLLAESGTCNDVAFLPDSRLVTSHPTGDVSVWDVDAGRLVARWNTAALGELKLIEEEEQITITHDAPGVSMLAVSPNGRTVAAGMYNGVVALFDVR